ncbi:MAG: transposase [Elusimicrobia bacterium]|nr:transposase [Elusimicrobiota bacterium]
MGSAISACRAYEPRRARESPLYRLVNDEIETWVIGSRAEPQRPEPCAEDSLRSFLMCGVHRFGVVRFLCKRCAFDLFVPLSCKRRLACPSCDHKRAVLESSRAAEVLLPEVPYRQWVLVIPKRLRYFVHRDKRLQAELSRIMGEQLTRFYRGRLNGPGESAPAQFHVIQRFGSKVNLHVHVHAVVSDGVFQVEEGVLRFLPAPPLPPEEVAGLSRSIRRKILLRMRGLKAVPREALDELFARPLGGFSLDASVRIEHDDRAALERLLKYVLRPALTVKRLVYRPDIQKVRYYFKKGWPLPGEDGVQMTLEWTPAEFMAKFARLIPPARMHLVRYFGALGPRSPLRKAVTRAAREKTNFQEICEGVAMSGVSAVVGDALRAARKAAGAAAKSWAACLRKVFEINQISCPSCGEVMTAVAVIADDGELTRLLNHLRLPADFPKTKRSRAPPGRSMDEAGQVDPGLDEWDGKDQAPSGE